MRINEIFTSVDGEVNYFGQGHISTFVRFSGCNLSCLWCDTKYSLKITSGKEMSVTEVFDEVEKLGSKKITITGGEPLLQKESLIELCCLLIRNNYKVSLETNGSIPILGVPSSVAIVADYKCQNKESMEENNFLQLTEKDVVKFVVSDEKDYQVAIQMKNYIKQRSSRLPKFAFAPVHPTINPNDLITWLVRDKEFDSILNIQLHKYIGVK